MSDLLPKGSPTSTFKSRLLDLNDQFLAPTAAITAGMSGAGTVHALLRPEVVERTFAEPITAPVYAIGLGLLTLALAYGAENTRQYLKARYQVETPENGLDLVTKMQVPAYMLGPSILLGLSLLAESDRLQYAGEVGILAIFFSLGMSIVTTAAMEEFSVSTDKTDATRKTQSK